MGMGMQRPVMDPMFDEDDPGALATPERRRPPLWKRAAGRLWRVVRWGVRCLFSKPLARRTPLRVEDGPPMMRWARAVGYRLLFAPMLIALTAAAFVFAGTHPTPRPIDGDPSGLGLYYDPVSFASRDGTRLEGWLVPLVDAKVVLSKGDRLLRTKRPAVVLVHDFGRSPQQMLPFLSALHEDGYVVLVAGLRGSSTAPGYGQTFGLRESEDVAAAVEVLRRRPFVDPERVAVIGIGTGATAALRVAAADEKVKATVLIDPARDAETVIADRIGPKRLGLRWMQPVCKWAFELGYRVDAEELELARYETKTANRPSLVLERDADWGTAARPMLKRALATPKKQPRQEAAVSSTSN